MALYQIKITKRAKRDLKKLDPDARQQISQAIDELAAEPRPPCSKPLKGTYKGYWRKRTGNYRIIYELLEEMLQITVIRAGHRKDVYD